jgi:hypothetical protein
MSCWRVLQRACNLWQIRVLKQVSKFFLMRALDWLRTLIKAVKCVFTCHWRHRVIGTAHKISKPTVTQCDTLLSHVMNIQQYLFQGPRGVRRNGAGVFVAPWDLNPPGGGIDSHVATWRQIPCIEHYAAALSVRLSHPIPTAVI